VSNLACRHAVLLIEPSTTRYSDINARHPLHPILSAEVLLATRSKREAHSFKQKPSKHSKPECYFVTREARREARVTRALTGDPRVLALSPSQLSQVAPVPHNTFVILRLDKVARSRARACVLWAAGDVCVWCVVMCVCVCVCVCGRVSLLLDAMLQCCQCPPAFERLALVAKWGSNSQSAVAYSAVTFCCWQP
jgi:hypothetical protein